MTSPVTIDQLDPASMPIDPNNNLLLIRQGLNDRKVLAGQLSNPSLASLSMLPGQLVASDVLLVGRYNGSTYDNYIVPPQYLGFLNNTKMWFYQAAAPLGWTIISGTGDRLLAVATVSLPYDGVWGGVQSGDWQQKDHELTKEQMPVHSHNMRYTVDAGSGNNRVARARTENTSSTFTTDPEGGLLGVTQGHNHGSAWRPAANVGILCVKDKLVGQ